MHAHSDISIYAKNEKECRANCSFAFSVVLNIACAHERERESESGISGNQRPLSYTISPNHTLRALLTPPLCIHPSTVYFIYFPRVARAPRRTLGYFPPAIPCSVCVCTVYTHTWGSLFCYFFSILFSLLSPSTLALRTEFLFRISVFSFWFFHNLPNSLSLLLARAGIAFFCTRPLCSSIRSTFFFVPPLFF